MAFMSVTDDVSHKPMSTFTNPWSNNPESTNAESNNLDMSTMAATSHEPIGTGVAALSLHVANVSSSARHAMIALSKSPRDVNNIRVALASATGFVQTEHAHLTVAVAFESGDDVVVETRRVRLPAEDTRGKRRRVS